MNRDVNISFSSGKKGSKRDLVRWISEGGEHEEQNASMILDKRYRPVHHLGTGTYGTVWRAVDSDSGEFVWAPDGIAAFKQVPRGGNYGLHLK